MATATATAPAAPRTNNPPGAYVHRINANPTPQELRTLYDSWASTYESDLVLPDQNYVAPKMAAQRVLKCLGGTGGDDVIGEGVEVLDAGCGTGWVGHYLAELGAKKIDGNDISPGMLDVARKGGDYRELNVVDLNERLDVKGEKYDVVTCVGTFLEGHVGSQALPEFVRVLKKGGWVVATVRDNVWVEKGFEEVVKRIEGEGRIARVEAVKGDYRKGAGVEAYLVVFQKV